MEGAVQSPTIRPINKGVIHRICSGQVILDLSSAVKELVENSLDAGASCVEISLKEQGEESFKVVDNGCGISPNNFQAIARKHHTSKIVDFPDLQSLTTFGFRGEALSSLCALGNLTVETRTKNESVGTHLTFDHTGLVTSERKTARQVGTTVTVEKLFSTLPVRSKDFGRNIRREYGKLITLLNAYALIAKGVRLVCTNTTGKNTKSVVLKTQGSGSLKDNIITLFGSTTFACLEHLSLGITDICKVEGFISKPGHGSGRNLGDRQFFYVNGRPVDMPKVNKLVNELYRSSNARQYPIAIMNFTISTKAYDVNVTPDKRKIFFSDEGSLILSLREAIEKIYSPNHCSYSINRLEAEDESNCEVYVSPGGSYVSSKEISPKGSKPKEAACSPEKIVDDIPLVKLKEGVHDSYVNGEGVQGKEEDSLSKDLTLSNCDNGGMSKSLSGYPPKKLRTFPMPNITIDKHAPSDVRAVKKDADSSSRSNLLQSSLTKFVTVNKRKHENSCMVLSEVPVLRNEMMPCQVRKTSSEMHAAISRSLINHHLGDDPTQFQKGELSEQFEAPRGMNEVATPFSDGCDVHEGGPGESIEIQEALPLDDGCSKAMSGKDLESISEDLSVETSSLKSSNMILDAPVPSGLEICSVLHFNIKDLRARRCQRLSSLLSKSLTYGRRNVRRCYTASTLENSQPENEEGKVKALAAATTELERFFRKEDFGRMEVIGQFNLGFIIGKVDQDLFIVDQHAADEKYNFERLSQSTVLNQQPLLQPMRLELSPEEEVIASIHMDIIRRNGFTLIEDLHAPPGRHFLLKAVPFSKNITFGGEDVKALISILSDSQGECSIISSYKMDTPDSICPPRVRSMLASRACRSSIMIGDSLEKSTMRKILQHLADLKSPWNCPHGRPTMRHLVDLTTVHKR